MMLKTVLVDSAEVIYKMFSFKSSLEKLNQWIRKARYPSNVRVELYNRLSALIDNNIKPRTAISMMKKEYELAGISKNDKSYKFLCAINKEFLNTTKIQEALKQYVPNYEYIIISGATKLNKPSEGLQEAAKISMRMESIKKIMKSALVPSMLRIIGGVGVVVAAYFLLSRFVNLIPIKNWPEYSSNYYYASEFLVQNGVFLSLFLLVIILVGRAFLLHIPTDKNIDSQHMKIRIFADNLFPFSAYKSFQGYIFLSAFSGMLQAGKKPDEALSEISKTANSYLRYHIKGMSGNLSAGAGRALVSTNLFDIDSRMSISIISETNDFREAVEGAAEKSISSTEKALKASNKVFLLLGWVVFMGALLGTMAATMMLSTITSI